VAFFADRPGPPRENMRNQSTGSPGIVRRARWPPPGPSDTIETESGCSWARIWGECWRRVQSPGSIRRSDRMAFSAAARRRSQPQSAATPAANATAGPGRSQSDDHISCDTWSMCSARGIGEHSTGIERCRRRFRRRSQECVRGPYSCQARCQPASISSGKFNRSACSFLMPKEVGLPGAAGMFSETAMASKRPFTQPRTLVARFVATCRPRPPAPLQPSGANRATDAAAHQQQPDLRAGFRDRNARSCQ